MENIGKTENHESKIKRHGEEILYEAIHLSSNSHTDSETENRTLNKNSGNLNRRWSSTE
jgi:hypothetical protein